jgi:psp operon transcriptional activator
MPDTRTDLPPAIGQSPAFLELMEAVSRAAALNRPVLVVGERGTGKEALAARLHHLSPRWEGPLVKVNCAALPDTLLDTELFGHEPGAFTGATGRRRGRFEQADGGTLLLDEIATASMQAQEKVLRAVEYGEVTRVGASTTLQVDVRLVAATNVDLPAAAAAGRFRPDLLDRLSFEVITLPPLRAHREDIPMLATHFARAFAAELGWHTFAGFTDAAMQRLAAHDWPGNVRELKNVVERAVFRTGTPEAPVATVEFDPFASPYRPATGGGSETPPAPAVSSAEPASQRHSGAFHEQVAALERRLLNEALAGAGGNRRTAARALELSYDQLRHQLRRHGLGGRRARDGSERRARR